MAVTEHYIHIHGIFITSHLWWEPLVTPMDSRNKGPEMRKVFPRRGDL